MMTRNENMKIQLDFDGLTSLLSCVFKKYGMCDKYAQVLAFNCASAERDGALSHGIFRIFGYISTIESGWVDANACPAIERVTPAWISVDAKNGFAQPVLEGVREKLKEKAMATGIAALTIKNSHHFGALWLDVEPFAEEGLVALTTVNSYKRVVPYGGHTAIYGTNPMAFAAPRDQGLPIVFDQASSSMAYGDVRLAAQNGLSLPLGVGINAEGSDTINPNEIIQGGSLLPFGGYKGSSIAMMIEIFSAVLTGGKFSFEVSRENFTGAETFPGGQFMLLIDPRNVSGRCTSERIDVLVDELRACGQSRLPGDRRYAQRAASKDGIFVDRQIYNRVKSLCS